MITTLTKTFTIAVQGKKEINEVVTLLRILQEFVFTPPSIQWDEIISLKIILKRQDSSHGKTESRLTCRRFTQEMNERIFFVCFFAFHGKQNKFVCLIFGRTYGAPKLLSVLSDL